MLVVILVQSKIFYTKNEIENLMVCMIAWFESNREYLMDNEVIAKQEKDE